MLTVSAKRCYRMICTRFSLGFLVLCLFCSGFLRRVADRGEPAQTYSRIPAEQRPIPKLKSSQRLIHFSCFSGSPAIWRKQTQPMSLMDDSTDFDFILIAVTDGLIREIMFTESFRRQSQRPLDHHGVFYLEDFRLWSLVKQTRVNDSKVDFHCCQGKLHWALKFFTAAFKNRFVRISVDARTRLNDIDNSAKRIKHN